MKINLLQLLSLSVLLTACGAVSPVISSHSDPTVDFKQYKSFAYFEPLDTDERYQTLLSLYLKQATSKEMEKRGLTFNPTEPDILINFSSKVVDKQMISHVPTTHHGGYYTYNGRLYHHTWIEYDPIVDRYQQGRLIVDIVDKKQNKMIWQGIASKRLYEDDVNQLDTTIPLIISDIFKSFPVPVTIIE